MRVPVPVCVCVCVCACVRVCARVCACVCVRLRGAKGTVGAVAVDSEGNLACATSTGGLLNKMEGRVGDSALVGEWPGLADQCERTTQNAVCLRAGEHKGNGEL